MSKVNLILKYLKYLSKWNKTASLLAVIDGVEKYPEKYDKEFNSLFSIAQLEYEDTKSMTSDKIISLEELVIELSIKIRNKKIDEILN